VADKRSLEYSGKLEAGEVASYLEALGRSLRDGRVVIESGSAAVELPVAGPIDVQLDAASYLQKGRCSLSLELEWRSTARPVRRPPVGLRIAGTAAEPMKPELDV